MAFADGKRLVQVVAGFSLSACKGQVTGIAGESGSGKTTALLGSIGYTLPGAIRLSGQTRIDGEQLPTDDNLVALRSVWARRVGYVSQDAVGSMNPARKIGSQFVEILTTNQRLRVKAARRHAADLLHAVRLPNPEAALMKYPHEFSGGQLQRIAIAMSIACNPEVLILDEPTTGLDVTTQADVLAMLRELIAQRGVAALYISHDLALLAQIADHLIVIYAGEVIESGPTPAVISAPRHPYTRALLDALPAVRERRSPAPLPGLPPGHVVTQGCPFANRCRWRVPECLTIHPPLVTDEDGCSVRCLRQPMLGPLQPATRRPAVVDAVRRTGAPLLRLDHLRCVYRRGRSQTVAVDDLHMEIFPGEVVALVGESGSGKSTIGRAIVGIHRPRQGELLWAGRPLAYKSERRGPAERREIQIVFQNPNSSLNPRHSVEQLVERPIALFRRNVHPRERREAVAAALREVQLDPALAERYPHQLSGGQNQRVAIARALAAQPRLVICDEIVSGQDVSVQAAILDLVGRMQTVHHMAVLFISHDLAVVRSIAEYVYVIHSGRIVEHGPASTIFDHPTHAYTRQLLTAAIGPPDSALSGAPAN